MSSINPKSAVTAPSSSIAAHSFVARAVRALCLNSIPARCWTQPRAPQPLWERTPASAETAVIWPRTARATCSFSVTSRSRIGRGLLSYSGATSRRGLLGLDESPPPTLKVVAERLHRKDVRFPAVVVPDLCRELRERQRTLV